MAAAVIGEEYVEFAVALLDTDFHAARDECVAGFEAAGQRHGDEPAAAARYVLEGEAVERDAVGPWLVGEGLDVELVGSDFVEAASEPMLLTKLATV